MEADRHDVLTKIGLVALACSSLVAVYRSRGDPGAVAFVVCADVALLLLFGFLRKYENARGEERGKIREVVWALTTVLTAMFASRVAPVMPPAVGVVVWLMAAVTVAGGFCALFLTP